MPYAIISANNKDHLALLEAADGSRIKISWEDLKPYCDFANPPRSNEEIAAAESSDEEGYYPENDYCAMAIVDGHLVVCMTEAQGQGGIVAICDLVTSKWVYIAMAEYIQSALPLFDHGLLLMLVNINVPYIGSRWSKYRVWVSALDGILDSQSDRSLPLPLKKMTTSRPQQVTQPSAIFEGWRPNATSSGLFFDSEAQMVHAIDGAEFATQYSLAEIKQAVYNKDYPSQRPRPCRLHQQ